MNVAVRYYTRSGNTKKLADAAADAAGCKAEPVTVPLPEKADILFLGCSYYAFDVDENVKQFIIQNKDNIGKIVCIGTSAMMKSMRKPVSKVADSVGVAVAKAEFHCRGQFKMFNKGRPDSDDIAGVYDFAKKIISE